MKLVMPENGKKMRLNVESGFKIYFFGECGLFFFGADFALSG